MNEQWIVSFPDGGEIPFRSEREARSFSARCGGDVSGPFVSDSETWARECESLSE